MVDIVVKDLNPKEYGKLQEIKKREEYRTWRGLIQGEILEKEYEKDASD